MTQKIKKKEEKEKKKKKELLDHTCKGGVDYTTHTLRASLSGTFLQTLPELVLAAVHRRGQRPPKGLGILIKLQALVYDILPSTTAVFSYAIGSRKLSANEQVFFIRAQTVVSLLQTTHIKQGVSFIATNKVYTSTNKTTIV